MGVTFDEVDVDDRVFFNWKQFIAFIIFFICIVSYLVIPSLNEWINTQMSYIFSDWQLALGLIGIVALSVGWYVLQAIGLFFVHLNIRVGNKLTGKGFDKFRYLFALYFISMIIANFVFGYTFAEPYLYLVSGIIFASSLIIFLGINRIKKWFYEKPSSEVEETKSMFPKKPEEDEYIEFKFFSKYTLYILVIIIIIILIISDYLAGNIGIINFLQKMWQLIRTNLVSSLLFGIFLCFTVFWKPLIWIVLVLIPYIANYLIRYTIRRKIQKIRIVMFVFVACLFIIKNLPVLKEIFGWSEVEYSLITLLLSTISTTLSAYVMRRWK